MEWWHADWLWSLCQPWSARHYARQDPQSLLLLNKALLVKKELGMQAGTCSLAELAYKASSAALPGLRIWPCPQQIYTRAVVLSMSLHTLADTPGSSESQAHVKFTQLHMCRHWTAAHIRSAPQSHVSVHCRPQHASTKAITCWHGYAWPT